jgi:hypothetical protein
MKELRNSCSIPSWMVIHGAVHRWIHTWTHIRIHTSTHMHMYAFKKVHLHSSKPRLSVVRMYGWCGKEHGHPKVVMDWAHWAPIRYWIAWDSTLNCSKQDYYIPYNITGTVYHLVRPSLPHNTKRPMSIWKWPSSTSCLTKLSSSEENGHTVIR